VSSRSSVPDLVFHGVAASAALLVLALIVAVFITLVTKSQPALGHFGARFLSTNAWNPVTEVFGGLASIHGTIVSTALAMLIATPLAFVIALFLVELAPPAVSAVVGVT